MSDAASGPAGVPMAEAPGDAGYWALGGISLRALAAGDEPAVMRLGNAGGEEAERAYDRIGLPMSPADSAAWLAARLGEAASSDRCAFLVERAGGGGGAPLGLIDVWEADRRSGVFRTGIKMLPGEGGRGYATSAYARVLDYYFFELRYQKCGVYIYDFNKKSIRFHEKFGFAEEGRLRRECYTQGRFHDAIWYGLLVEAYGAWRASHPARQEGGARPACTAGTPPAPAEPSATPAPAAPSAPSATPAPPAPPAPAP